jgi:hypothetical protein
MCAFSRFFEGGVYKCFVAVGKTLCGLKAAFFAFAVDCRRDTSQDVFGAR